MACHGDDGRGAPHPAAVGSTRAPSLSGSARVTGHRDYIVKALLHGITGTGGRQELQRSDAADGIEQRPVDRRRRVVRAHQLRQLGDRWSWRPTWLASEATTAAAPRAVDGEPAWRARCPSCSCPTIGGRSPPATVRRPRRTRSRWRTGPLAHLSKPACGFRSSCQCRRSVTEVQFTSPPQGGGRGGPPPAQTYPRDYRVEVSTDGAAWTDRCCRRSWSDEHDDVAFAPVPAPFRSHHAHVERERGAGVGHPAPANLSRRRRPMSVRLNH